MVGDFSVLQLVNISQSLQSQSEIESPQNSTDIHKAVVEQAGRYSVVYFVGSVAFGPGSKIRILKDTGKQPLLKPDDFVITVRKPLVHDISLISRLLRAN